MINPINFFLKWIRYCGLRVLGFLDDGYYKLFA